MPKVKSEKDKRRVRRRSKEAFDLNKPKHHQRIVPNKKEDEAERRFRKHRKYDEISPDEES